MRSTFPAGSVSGPAVYYLGIVDFLQHWSTSKKFERLAKTYLYRKDPDGLSVMEPGQYMLRFQSKMDQIFDLDEHRNSAGGARVVKNVKGLVKEHSEKVLYVQKEHENARVEEQKGEEREEAKVVVRQHKYAAKVDHTTGSITFNHLRRGHGSIYFANPGVEHIHHVSQSRRFGRQRN
jgi:hypothetical protein